MIIEEEIRENNQVGEDVCGKYDLLRPESETGQGPNGVKESPEWVTTPTVTRDTRFLRVQPLELGLERGLGGPV